MHKLTIRQLFFFLIAFAISISIIYISTSYIYMKQTVEKSLDLESINKAYYVTKKLIEMNDRLALEYEKNEEDMYLSLKEAQAYFKEHGPSASLSTLQKKLQENKKDLSYHIYIINSDYVIANTTYEPDLGLDFHIVPDSLKDLEKTYLNPDYIDLSSIKDDGISHDYKRYILQRSKSGDYLVQLSLTIKGDENVSEFTTNLSKRTPTLINSALYSIYHDSYKSEYIHLVWSEEYRKMTKKDRLLVRNVTDIFMNKFDPENKIKSEEYKKYIFEFAANGTYRDSYFYRDKQYIHRVMMPMYSHINADEKTVHILSLEFDETKAKDITENITIITVIVWILLGVLTFVVIMLINNRIIKPIAMLQSKMKNKDSVEKDIVFKNNDEISSMMSIYNQLLLDLKREIISNEELLEQFKIFTGNAIHQIRTPVSVMKIALEMIETENKDAVLQIESSLISIEHMYDSLAYGLQEGDVEFIAEELDFSKLLQERIAVFLPVALAHDTQINSKVQPDIYVKMNKTEAEYLIDNTISNAIKYGTTDKYIGINLSSVGEEIILSIESSGKQIEDTDVIFERYYRADKSRRGSGIGLHMVKNICKKNSILINVEYVDGYNRFNYYLSKI